VQDSEKNQQRATTGGIIAGISSIWRQDAAWVGEFVSWAMLTVMLLSALANFLDRVVGL
jgi:chaperonin GroEL (HSP60 family)